MTKKKRILIYAFCLFFLIGALSYLLYFWGSANPILVRRIYHFASYTILPLTLLIAWWGTQKRKEERFLDIKENPKAVLWQMLFFAVLLIALWIYGILWRVINKGELNVLLIVYVPIVGWIAYVWAMVSWERGFKSSSQCRPLFKKTIFGIAILLTAGPAILALMVSLAYFVGLFISTMIPFPYSFVIALIVTLPIGAGLVLKTIAQLKIGNR